MDRRASPPLLQERLLFQKGQQRRPQDVQHLSAATVQRAAVLIFKNRCMNESEVHSNQQMTAAEEAASLQGFAYFGFLTINP